VKWCGCTQVAVKACPMDETELARSLGSRLGPEVSDTVDRILVPGRGLLEIATEMAPLVACAQLVIDCAKILWSRHSSQRSLADESAMVSDLLRECRATNLDPAQRAAIIYLAVCSARHNPGLPITPVETT
jgi:hypothetical protein